MTNKGRPKLLDIKIGDKFGDLECIDSIYIGKGAVNKSSNIYYKMRCVKCNRTKLMLSSTIRLQHGITHKACGKGLKTKNPVFYSRWLAMRTRTTNPNYEHADCYIERGISSEKYKYFIDFYDDMYESFKQLADEIGEHNVSLERIDVNGDYTKENCKWINKPDQYNNTRRTVYFKVEDPDGNISYGQNARKYALDHDLDPSSVYSCLNGHYTHHKHYKFYKINPYQLKCND